MRIFRGRFYLFLLCGLLCGPACLRVTDLGLHGTNAGETEDDNTDETDQPFSTDSETSDDSDECIWEDPFDASVCENMPTNSSGIFYVNGDVLESGDGTSWESAFKSIQEGIDAAYCQNIIAQSTDEQQVWVAKGRYRVCNRCRTDSLWLRHLVALYGGFDGTENSLNDRILQASNPTTIDGACQDAGFGVYHVVTVTGGTTINGIHITGGNADGSDSFKEHSYKGAGLYNKSGFLGIVDSHFNLNEAIYIFEDRNFEDPDILCSRLDQGQGGAIYNHAGQLTVSRSRFVDNKSVNGGAIFSKGEMGIEDSEFVRNTALGVELHDLCVKQDPYDCAVGYGGALASENRFSIVSSVFQSNEADRGGAIDFSGSSTVSDSYFFSNRASGRHKSGDDCEYGTAYGGAISTRSDSLRLTNCVLAGNSAMYGGAISLGHGNTPYSEVINSTFFGNFVEDSPLATGRGGAVYYGGQSSVLSSLTNCIFWENSAPDSQPIVGDFEISYSDIEGGADGVGNIDIDPQFSAASEGDFSLLASSPCIDAAFGDKASSTDILGNLRFDSPSIPNSGSGDPDFVDMGAIEFQPE